MHEERKIERERKTFKIKKKTYKKIDNKVIKKRQKVDLS